MCHKLMSMASTEPKENEKYGIYHFFIKDPESRTVEFQVFSGNVQRYMTAEQVLLSRRSVRHFEKSEVSQELLHKIFDICRFAPTSKNSQSYYFMVIKNRKKVEQIGAIRGENTAPISRAPLAIAICADPTKSRRPDQDACIAAYHFIWYRHMLDRQYGF